MSETERYVLLASAVAGRRVSVHRSSGNDLLAYSDGQSIVLPTVVAGTATAPLEVWSQVIAQAALIAAGSLDSAVLRQLVGRGPVIRQRYAYLEMLRASRVVGDLLPLFFTGRTELLAAPLTSSASESLTLAASKQTLPDAPAYFGTIRPLMTLRRAVSNEGLSALTKKQQQGEFKTAKIDELSPEEEDDAEESKILKLFQNPFGGNNPMSEMLNKILGAGASKGKRESNADENGGAEMPVGRIERALRRGVNAVLTKLPIELPEIDLTAESQTLAYPEWDVHKKSYRQDWVFVEEVEPFRFDGPQDLSQLLVPPSRELQRQLGSLGLDHEMHRRQKEGADLDVGPLIDCAIDLKTGHSPATPAIYRSSRRTRRDLAVAVVLDISGSTGEKNGQGESVFDKQMQLAYQLSHTLNTLGDTVAMFGFHSWGRKLVRVVRLKGHEERWSTRVSERMAMLEPVGYTRTGTAIRHGTRLLRTGVRLPNRLLVLITDGIAYDQDYEQSYAESDTRKALEEAKSLGTACVCLSVGSGTQTDKLVEIFGPANILAVDEVAEVTSRIREVCRKAVASVSQRRLVPVGANSGA